MDKSKVAEAIEEIRKRERAGIMGEPAICLPLDKLHFATLPDTGRLCFIRLDTLRDLFKAYEAQP